MDTDATRFDILLAEDDPVSRTFLAEAAPMLQRLHAEGVLPGIRID